MTDAEYETTRAKLREWFDDWQLMLGLGSWEIQLLWTRERADDDKANAGRLSLATVEADWRYQRAEITLYMPTLVECTGKAQENTVVHELLHLYLAELENKKNQHRLDHEERVVTQIANAFLRLRDSMVEKEKLDERQAASQVDAQGGAA